VIETLSLARVLVLDLMFTCLCITPFNLGSLVVDCNIVTIVLTRLQKHDPPITLIFMLKYHQPPYIFIRVTGLTTDFVF
jgi:hypothetical protein